MKRTRDSPIQDDLLVASIYSHSKRIKSNLRIRTSARPLLNLVPSLVAAPTPSSVGSQQREILTTDLKQYSVLHAEDGGHMQREKRFGMEEGDTCGDPRVRRVAKHSTVGEVVPLQLFKNHVPPMSLVSSCLPVFALFCGSLLL
jgi:hypothetical protein